MATGNTVVFQAISELILESALVSLAVASAVPIAVAVALIAGSMRALGISFNAFTATILALTIGLGIDYSVHVVHRFADERREHGLDEALSRTVRGTGGALTRSVLTTAFGIGALVLAVLDVLGQFGVLTALSVFYAFLVSLLVLPSVLVLWDRWARGDPGRPTGTPTVSEDGGGRESGRL